MPYVEVWVDEPEPDKQQVKAIRDLVSLALAVANRQWPSDDAVALERAARHLGRMFPAVPVPETDQLFPVDKKYREWRASREVAHA